MDKHGNQSNLTHSIVSNKKYVNRIVIMVFIFLSIALIYALENKKNEYVSQIDQTSGNASDVVIKYLEAKKNNDTNTLKSLLWKTSNDQNSNTISELEEGLGVISLLIDKVEVSEKETQIIKKQYIGSNLAKNYQWSDDFIKENLIVVYAKYTVDYDNTKVPYNEGKIAQYFYLLRANKDSSWRIWEQSYDAEY